ncbi:MAG: hypothetical protein IPL61_14380 [Myxococcales bacterium]|nr:hypothetical protein [Myxococcales bacterium]
MTAPHVDPAIARARRRAGLLLYAAIQFVVLTAIAMVAYAGGSFADPSSRGYQFTRNFLSELGATRSWGGRPNHVSAGLFALALGGLGLAFAAFAGTWRAFAFGRGRARRAGVAAQACGTASGAAFLAVAVTPINVALTLHNAFVTAAFGLLFGYAASITVVSWRNGAPRARLAASLAYLLLVGAYFATVVVAVRTGVTTARGFQMMVISQKLVAGASMLFIGYVTLATRRELAPGAAIAGTSAGDAPRRSASSRVRPASHRDP